ncbi:hypothetical protein GGF31_007808 [Allomyces arbusculus]|nr:hypothetical protein GGF31_007808 [Allomyces arbusculus]
MLHAGSGVNQRVRPVIGLEFHAQIASRVKLFSPMTTSYFGQPPNCAVAPLDLALPGAMPVLNREPVVLALATALALDCTIPPVSRFERKHYLYPDLAPGYQITQKTQPLAVNGHIHLGAYHGLAEPRTVRIEQIQLEQDTAKSSHDNARTAIDYNRAGTGLMEIVTLPDLESPQEAAALVKALQAILRTLGSCDANLEEGSLRVDVNVSVALDEKQLASERVEIKNIATVSGLVAALEFEITRQSALLASGTRGHRETRGFDSATQQTFPLRAKESARDYRFAADADLPPLHIRPSEIDAVRASLPPLPTARHETLATQFPSLAHDQLQWLLDGCPLLDSAAIANEQSRARSRYAHALQGVSVGVEGESGWTSAASYYVAMMASVGNDAALAVPCFHWLATELTGRVMKLRDRQAHTGGPVQPWIVTPAELASIPRAIQDGVVSGKAGKQVLDVLVAHGLERGKGGKELTAEAVAQEKGWTLVRDETQIAAWAREAMAASPRKPGLKVDKYATWVVGQVLARSKGRADPQVAQAVVAGLVAEGSA